MIRRTLALALSVAAFAGLAACGDGSGQKAKGDVKETVGSVIGDEQMKRDGQKDQVVGGVKEAAGDVGDAVKDAVR